MIQYIKYTRLSINYNFEWDPTKAKSNLSKHKISFEDATLIFKDKNSISLFDESHSEDEERWATTRCKDIQSQGCNFPRG